MSGMRISKQVILRSFYINKRISNEEVALINLVTVLNLSIYWRESRTSARRSDQKCDGEVNRDREDRQSERAGYLSDDKDGAIGATKLMLKSEVQLDASL
jgi:hypothetical protein